MSTFEQIRGVEYPTVSGWLRTDPRWMARLVALASCASFLPYPAISIGNASALQLGNLLALILCVPLLAMPVTRLPIRAYFIIVAPLCISAYKAVLTGGAGQELELALKSTIVWSVSGVTAVFVMGYVHRYQVPVLLGISAAMLLHCAVGTLQLVSFQSGTFPLTWLYVNPSFLSVQDNVTVISRYIQRPFGLFPEPSAMSSSLAPFVILFFAMLGGVLRSRARLLNWQKAVMLCAATGSLALIIVSRSGHAAITLMALAAIAFAWLLKARANQRTFAIIVGGTTIFLPLVIWAASMSLGDRLGGRSNLGNSSWEERATSLNVGLGLVTDGNWSTVLFGLGPGLSAPAIERTAHLEAIWSILLTYVYETGMIGALALAWIGCELARQWRALQFNLTFLCMVVVWLVGITLTTSYNQLLPPWVALGWLLSWPDRPRDQQSGRRIVT